MRRCCMRAQCKVAEVFLRQYRQLVCNFPCKLSIRCRRIMAMAGRISDELTPYLLKNQESDDAYRIGIGSFGSVYQVTVNGFPCIIKRLHDILIGQNVGADDRQAIRQRFRQECILHSRLRHPNIVQFIGVCYGKISTDELSLVMEKLYTDLEKCLNDYQTIPLPIQLSILLDVAYGLLYLHSQTPAIIHRDVKASNVLLTNDMRAKLADLGVSKIIDVHPLSEVARTMCPGTPGVMPPEALVRNPLYTTKLDDFSFGTLVLHIVNHEFPMPFETDDFQRGQISIAKRRYWLEKMGETHCLYRLVVRCLQDDPETRLGTSEICSILESLSKHVHHKKRFKDVLQMYEALSGFETALHEANKERRGITVDERTHYNERLEEMEEIIERKEEELSRALEETQVAREDAQVAQQEVQAKTAQVKQYKKQVDSLKVQVTELEKFNEILSQEFKKLKKKLQKANPNTRRTGSVLHTTQYSDSVSLVTGLEKKLAEMEMLYEEERKEADRLRRYVHAVEVSPPPLPPKRKLKENHDTD